MNKYLRGELPVDMQTKQLLDNATQLVNQALAKLPVRKATVIRRIDLTPEQLQVYSIGNDVTFDAFTSTTVHTKDVVVGGRGNVRFVIQSHTGRYIGDLSEYQTEREVLLGSPTHYEVKNIKNLTAEKGYIEIYLQEKTHE